MSRLSDALTMTPGAAKGLLALAVIAALFATDRLATRVAEREASVEILQRQMADLERIAAAPDPAALSEQVRAELAAASASFLKETTPGLNGARVQTELKRILDECRATRSLVTVSPQDAEEGSVLQPYNASVRFRIQRNLLPDCLAGIGNSQMFFSVETMTWQRTGTVVMNVRAMALPPASARNTAS